MCARVCACAFLYMEPVRACAHIHGKVETSVTCVIPANPKRNRKKLASLLRHLASLAARQAAVTRRHEEANTHHWACRVLDELGMMAKEAAAASLQPLPDDDMGVMYFHSPNEALYREVGPDTADKAERAMARGKALHYAQVLIGLGVLPGFPDLVVLERPPLMPGFVGLALEVKSRKGGASEDQQRVGRMLVRRGFLFEVPKTEAAIADVLVRCGWDVPTALQRIEARSGRDRNGRLVRAPGGARAGSVERPRAGRRT